MADVEQQNVVAATEDKEEVVKKVETPEKAKVESPKVVVEKEEKKEEKVVEKEVEEEEKVVEKAEEKAEETPVAVVTPQKRSVEEVLDKEESPLKKPKLDDEEAAVTEEAAA